MLRQGACVQGVLGGCSGGASAKPLIFIMDFGVWCLCAVSAVMEMAISEYVYSLMSFGLLLILTVVVFLSLSVFSAPGGGRRRGKTKRGRAPEHPQVAASRRRRRLVGRRGGVPVDAQVDAQERQDARREEHPRAEAGRGEEKRAEWAYAPQKSDELELREGDRVAVLSERNDGWAMCKNKRSGKTGLCPANYLS